MDPTQYIFFIILFLLSGFFSATELALMSLPKHKLDSLVKQKKFGSQALVYIKERSDRLLITILVGNNLVNVYAAALATQISIELAKSSNIEESLAIGLATGLITLLILVFGEIVPKSFAIKNAETISLKVAPLYKKLIFIMWPVTFILERITLLFTGKSVAVQITEEEIESFINEGRNSGTLEDMEHERLRNAFQFNDTLVEEVMIPRVKVDAISSTATISEALEYYMSHTHSRIPVYQEQIDNVIGVITIRDILREQSHGNSEKTLWELHFKKVIKVPLNQPIDNLLETFKQTRQHIAIVIDEYGWVAGITTMEDIVEEVFGEIQDETDFETDDIIEKGENIYVVDSGILLHDILDEFGLEFPDIGMDEKEFGSETISYIITHKLERFPVKHEEICFELETGAADAFSTLCMKVLEVDDGVIGQVEITKK